MKNTNLISKAFQNILFIFITLLASTPAFSAEMAWFKGSVDQALAQAKESKKPTLIYWGAAWCPPCHALKAVAFKDKEFTDASKNFVTVYLDGDTTDAQFWGEKFAITGYPTLLVLNENGEEMQRLGASQPVAGLTAELLQAGRNAQPIESLLEDVLNSPDPLKIPIDSWQRLAHHGWDYNPKWDNRAEELTAKLNKIAEKIPGTFADEKLEFKLLVFNRRITGLKEGEALSVKEKSELESLIKSILSDKKQMFVHMQSMIFGAPTIMKGLYPDPEKAKIPTFRFVMEYRKALWTLLEEKSLTLQNRTYIISTIVDLSYGTNVQYPELTSAEQIQIKTTLIGFLNKAKNDHERVVIFNVMPDAFKKIGETDEARKLLLKNENKVGVKNYIYSTLSELDLSQGKLDSALNWAEKAYRISEGAATRAQWGRNYVSLLIDMTPENAERIEKDAFSIFNEGLSVTDGLKGRNKRSMTKLQTKFLTWAKEKNTPLDAKKYAALSAEKCVGQVSEFVNQCRDFVKDFEAKK